MSIKEIKKELVSVITVNYNQTAVTCQMLDSFKKVKYKDIELIVVDNGSKDRSIEEIVKTYPEVIFINSEKNLGFAGGNNLGLEQAKGEFILFINNDTEVDPDFIDPLIAKLKESDKIAMVSPKIMFYYHPGTIQFAGYTDLNKTTIRNRLIGYREKDTGQYNTSHPTPFGHGAAMMVKRETINKIGPMADIYFLYYEEIDWCTRLTKAEYQIWYVADSLVFHKESVSTGKMSPLKIHYLTRNRILYTRRNINGLRFFLSMVYQILIAGPKNMIQFLVQGRFDLLSASYRGFVWHLAHLSDKEIHLNK
jgi:GT2 family glycosyltransferase